MWAPEVVSSETPWDLVLTVNRDAHLGVQERFPH